MIPLCYLFCLALVSMSIPTAFASPYGRGYSLASLPSYYIPGNSF